MTGQQSVGTGPNGSCACAQVRSNGASDGVIPSLASTEATHQPPPCAIGDERLMDTPISAGVGEWGRAPAARFTEYPRIPEHADTGATSKVTAMA